MTRIDDYLGAVFDRPAPAQATQVGSLPLAPHQTRAVAALVAIVEAFSGALLADAVGLGKTRVCLATAWQLLTAARARGVRGPVWFVVPARLTTMWAERARRAGFRDDQFEVVSHTAMSRGQLPASVPALLVVDEAHRFRNPATRRYRTLSQAAADAPVVLATATPVANSRADLQALLRIFLGDADCRPWLGVDVGEAFRRGGPELLRVLERLVVRRTSWEGDAARRPSTRLELLPYEPGAAEAWVWANLGERLASNPLVLLRDDWPTALFVEHALRLWESGPGALAELMSRLVSFHERWLEADEHGKNIDRGTFRELFGERPDQSVLPFMFGQAAPAGADMPQGRPQQREERPLRADVVADLARLRELAGRVEQAASDLARERAILSLVVNQPGKLLIFTSYRNAARSLFDRLVQGLGPDARVGLVTGDEARATGLGRTSASEVLKRFAPGAMDLELPRHQTLDVLVATDCIAEGVDLQDCGRIVLADLPYSPLRVEQRIGRLLRPGSPHDEVSVYLPRPRNWNDSLGMRRRLSSKLGDAAQAGTPYTALGGVSSEPLAVLTRRDAWLRALPHADATSDTPAPFVVVETGGEDAVWLVARLTDGEHSEQLVVRAAPDGSLESGWHELLGRVDELTRGSPKVVARPAEGVRADLVERARGHADRVASQINAARIAPFAVSLDAVVHRAYRAIVEWADTSGVEIDHDTLRQKLLRPWPRGIERRIAGWIDEPWRGARELDELPVHPTTCRVAVCEVFVIDARPCIAGAND
jgi:superfamily II DNA or RNA helicase